MSEPRHLMHAKNASANTSVTNVEAKIPATTRLNYGEIGVNYGDGYETLFIKNSSGEIVPFPTMHQINALAIVESNIKESIGLNEDLSYTPSASTISAETTIYDALEVLADKVKTMNNNASSYTYTAGDNIDINNKTISVTGLPKSFKTINGTPISGSGNIQIASQITTAFTPTVYPTKDGVTVPSGATPVSVGNSMDEAFEKVEHTLSELSNYVIANNGEGGTGITAIRDAVGLNSSMQYTGNTSTSHYISASTNVTNALQILDTAVNNANTNKQDKLVSGLNIKTVNNESLLGSGNLDIPSGNSVSFVQNLTSGDTVGTITINGTATTLYCTKQIGIVTLTKAQYDALATKDNNTIYLISD